MAIDGSGGEDLESLLTPVKQDAPEQGVQEIVYLRRRPMHPGRFFAFVKRCFGPLEQELDKSSQVIQPAAGGSRLSALCRRRQQPTLPSVSPEDEKTTNICETSVLNAPVLPEFGACQASWVQGCLWFAGSDDRKAEWLYACPADDTRGYHVLRCGQAWPGDLLTPLEDQTGAGERLSEVRIRLRMPEGSTKSEAAGAFALAEQKVRAELDACLLTRQEARALEVGEQEVMDAMQVSQWEFIRAGGHDGSSILAWSPVLGTLELVLNVVHAMPGTQSLGAIGQALARRVTSTLDKSGKLAAHNAGAVDLDDLDECRPCNVSNGGS